MIVHFVGSKKSIETSISLLRKIVDAIHKEEHILALGWIEPTYMRISKKAPKEMDWAAVFQEGVESVTRADVVIAETTYNTFGVGFQVAAAIYQKKPVLLLRQETSDNEGFARGIESDLVEQKTYNEKNVEQIVKKFLTDNDIQTKDMRFNFFIDRPIYNYLRWSSQRTGKTKAEILRELVEREISRDKPNV